MATTFMATSRMTIIRIFINNEALTESNWSLVNGSDELGSGTDSIANILALEYEHIEIYLAPHLATIFKVDIEQISDRKINDELLLGLVEEYLVEDLENCKPLLMRVSSGESYVAILYALFYTQLISEFNEHIKQVKFIQPLPFITEYKDNTWTVFLSKEYKFVRTSLFEYYILDDSGIIPDVLGHMLQNYSGSEINVYAEDVSVVEYIESTYPIQCNKATELHYGTSTWNFYNEKSRRFNLKLNQSNKKSLLKLSKFFGFFASVYVICWVINLGYLIINKYNLQSQVAKNLTGIIRVDSYQANLLSKVDEQLNATYHTKGLFAPSDFAGLFDVFLRNVPEINQSMIVGLKYSGSTLNVFLNSQFTNANFANDREILLTKRILANLSDYSSYQAQNSNNAQNNNGGGILDNNSTDSAAQMSDASWVISLQTVTRLDVLNESSVKATN